MISHTNPNPDPAGNIQGNENIMQWGVRVEIAANHFDEAGPESWRFIHVANMCFLFFLLSLKQQVVGTQRGSMGQSNNIHSTFYFHQLVLHRWASSLPLPLCPFCYNELLDCSCFCWRWIFFPPLSVSLRVLVFRNYVFTPPRDRSPIPTSWSRSSRANYIHDVVRFSSRHRVGPETILHDLLIGHLCWVGSVLQGRKIDHPAQQPLSDNGRWRATTAGDDTL